MTFVFIHGSFGSPKTAWFPWLKKNLEQMGHEVIAPQFPVDQWSRVAQLNVDEYKPTQNLSSWFKTFDALLPDIKQKQICIVGHSMGTLFTLHVVDRYSMKINNAYFIAPFLYPATKEELKDKTVALINRANLMFYKNDFDFNRIRAYINRSIAIYSNDDPYIAEWEALEFAEKVGSTTIKLIGLGHMGSESGMKDFPQLLDAIKQDNP